MMHMESWLISISTENTENDHHFNYRLLCSQNDEKHNKVHSAEVNMTQYYNYAEQDYSGISKRVPAIIKYFKIVGFFQMYRTFIGYHQAVVNLFQFVSKCKT